MEPLHADLLYTIRSVFDPPGVDVERGAHSDHGVDLDAAKLLGHETLLFGSAQPDPHVIRMSLPDLLPQIVGLLRREAAERRAVRPDDADARKLFPQDFAKPLGHTRLSSIQEMRAACYDRALADFHHEVGTINAAHCAMALQA